ncbi:MAG: hypothetical protein M0Q44_01440 [Methylobacter sp.]|jgi:hypothetical protein|nr:hypothetical protein [Methylobacter sp.]
MSTTLADLATRFETSERPVGNMLDAPGILALAIAATNFYAGYANLAAHLAIPIADPAPVPPTPYPAITGATEISVSEWAVIRSLFMLYVERETAIQLEASRGLGVDVFGRSSSEISSDIALYESNLPSNVFCSLVITI